MAISAHSIISHYHDVLHTQRENILEGLRYYPEYEESSAASEKLLQSVVHGLESFGINAQNAIFAIDGSFSFGLGTDKGAEPSDIDGVLLVTDLSVNTDVLQIQVDEMIMSIGLESNLRIFQADWTPDRNDTLAKADQLQYATVALVGGRYIWGNYDESRILSIIGDSDHAVLDELNRYFDEFFWFMYQESHDKYINRLTEGRTIRKES